MRGFLETLAARAVGVPPVLRPRAAHRFEPRGGGSPGGGLPRDLGPWSGSRSFDAEAGLEVETSALSALASSTDPPPQRDGAPRSGGDADAPPPTGPRTPGPTRPRGSVEEAFADQVRTPPAWRRQDLRPALRGLVREAVDQAGAGEGRPAEARLTGPEQNRRSLGRADGAHEPGAHEPGAHEPGAHPRAYRPGREDPGEALGPHELLGLGELPGLAEAALSAPAGRLDPHSPDPGHEAERLARDRDRRVPTGASDASPRRATRPAPARATGRVPDVDLAALLRGEVFAALVERGAVRASERPVIAPPGKRPSSPRPGTSAIRAEGVSTAGGRARATPHPEHDGASDAGPPTVHLHIDRVSVTRAAPAAPTPPAQARSSVDHAAYLARRRERG